MSTQIILTATGANTWTVPSDFTAINTVEVIGGGATGGNVGGGLSGVGGGGGAYALKNNLALTPGAVINYTIGTAGNDTWFNTSGTVLAKGATGQIGGSAASSIGDSKFSGGLGSGTISGFGGTGGGAAGLNGAGAAGNTDIGVRTGGQGDNGHGGAGGTLGNPGAAGTEWGSVGSGGGGSSAGGGFTSGAGGLYGAGGGGATNAGGSPGVGAQGIIVINYTSSNPRYWVGGTGNWDASTTTNWSLTSGGTGGASVPASFNSVIFDGNSGAGTVTISATATCINLDFTGYTGTLVGTSALNIHGSLTLGTSMTFSCSGTITFVSTSTGNTITCNGHIFLGNIVFNGVGGSWLNQDSFTAATITLTNGTWNTGSQNIDTNSFTFSAGTLNMGSSNFTLASTGTVWNVSPGVTLNAGTSTIAIVSSAGSSKTFVGQGLTYYNLYLSGTGAGAFVITGSNTFNDFICDTPPHTINFTAGTTQKVANWSVSGTAGNLMTLQSTSSGTPFHLFKSTSGVASSDYLSLKDSHVSSI